MNFSLWLNANVKEKIQTSNPFFWKTSDLWTRTHVKPCCMYYLITYFQQLSVVGKQNAESMLATWALRGERSEQFISKQWIINLMCLLSSEVPSQIGPSVLALLVQCSPGSRWREWCWRDREPGGEGWGLWPWAAGRAVTCDRCVSGGKGQDVFRHPLGWSCTCYNPLQNSSSVPGAHTDNQCVSDLRDLSDRVWLCSNCSFMCYFP